MFTKTSPVTFHGDVDINYETVLNSLLKKVATEIINIKARDPNADFISISHSISGCRSKRAFRSSAIIAYNTEIE